jgi:hypothetical protein
MTLAVIAIKVQARWRCGLRRRAARFLGISLAGMLVLVVAQVLRVRLRIGVMPTIDRHRRPAELERQ